MCGRFTQNYTWHQVHKFLSVLGAPRNLRPYYNIAPTTDVVRLNAEGKRELVSMRWALELPPKLVQERLGHSSIMMTMDVYGHLFPRGDDSAELVEAERLLLG